MPVVISQHLLNVFVQLANIRGFKNKLYSISSLYLSSEQFYIISWNTVPAIKCCTRPTWIAINVGGASHIDASPHNVISVLCVHFIYILQHNLVISLSLHGRARPQVAILDGLRIWRAAWRRWQPTMGGLPSLRVDVGLTNPHCRSQVCYEMSQCTDFIDKRPKLKKMKMTHVLGMWKANKLLILNSDSIIYFGA
jgi:hypothetical protein